MRISAAEIVGHLMSSDAVLIVPVGLPGSGKSTLGRRLASALSWAPDAIVSTDHLRVAVGGRRDWLGDEELVFEIADQLAAARLRNGLPVYFDATNVQRDRRDALLDIARLTGRPSLTIRMDVSERECLTRRIDVPYDRSTWAALVASFDAIDWDEFSDAWTPNSVVMDALDRLAK